MKKTTKKQAPKRIRKPDPRRRPKPAPEEIDSQAQAAQENGQPEQPSQQPPAAHIYATSWPAGFGAELEAAARDAGMTPEAVAAILVADIPKRLPNRFQIGLVIVETEERNSLDRAEDLHKNLSKAHDYRCRQIQKGAEKARELIAAAARERGVWVSTTR